MTDMALARKVLPPDDRGQVREAVVYPLTYGRARLHVGPPDVGWTDDAW